jgi:serine protease Do
MPNGEKVDATIVGTDSSTDLAVVKVNEGAEMLAPVSIGATENLKVGSTVIAIGNPGGEVLANTVTQGIVSALERTSVNASNTSRRISYIQHDASINSGNSGGGLFNYKGELIGINTLKYGGSAYSGVSTEGLGFAIPIDTAYPIALQLIEKGEVIRPQMGITVSDMEGPKEPMSNYPPASVCIRTVEEGSPAEKAGLKQYDFIYAINGERVTNFRELTSILDKHQAGDIVTVTVVRYANAFMQVQQNNYNYYDDMFDRFFGGYGYGYGNNGGNNQQNASGEGQLVVGGGYEFINVDVTLELPAEK